MITSKIELKNLLELGYYYRHKTCPIIDCLYYFSYSSCFTMANNWWLWTIYNSWTKGLNHLSVPFTDSSTIDWDATNAESSQILSPVHRCLASEEISTSEAADILSALFKVHLERYEVLPTPGTSHSISKVLHRTRRIDRVVQNLRELKNSSQRNIKNKSVVNFIVSVESITRLRSQFQIKRNWPLLTYLQ